MSVVERRRRPWYSEGDGLVGAVAISVVERRRRPWWSGREVRREIGGDVCDRAEATSVVEQKRCSWWSGRDVRGAAKAIFAVEQSRHPWWSGGDVRNGAEAMSLNPITHVKGKPLISLNILFLKLSTLYCLKSSRCITVSIIQII